MTTEAKLLPQLRRICLRLPGTSETVSWGHPTFKAGGTTFCVLERYKGHLTMCFKLPAGDATAALRDARFFRTPYVGHKGWVSLIVDTPPGWSEVAELALKSFCETPPTACARGSSRGPRDRGREQPGEALERRLKAPLERGHLLGRPAPERPAQADDLLASRALETVSLRCPSPEEQA